MRLDGTREAPKVCVIIPVYKTEKYLQGCVDSVLRQNYANLAVILVDDGSPDAAPALCDALAAEHPQVHVVHKSNGGLSSARNAGLDQVPSDTQFVLFLDSDDQLAAEAISGLVSEAVQTGADIVMPDRYEKVQEATGSSKTALLFGEQHHIEDPRQFALQVVIGNARAWRATSVLYAYALIQRSKAHFPVGRISEDVVFNLQICLCANRIAFYSRSTLLCLKRQGSITNSFSNGFEETIFFIDDCARDFIRRAGFRDEVSMAQADALLYRNIVVYFFSIMSSKNQMSKAEKEAYVFDLLQDQHIKRVVQQKHAVPYFESRKVRLLLALVYFLLRHRLYKAAVVLLKLIPN